MLPDIDFSKIRLHRGTQDHAFEELCCQLAALEPRADSSEFLRKGRGADGGIECLVRQADGSETGWQAKYYQKMDGSLLRSLSGSVGAALAKHPKLKKFIVCIPFDLSDGDTKVTALSQWEGWRETQVKNIAAAGRTIEIELWGASQIKQRLSVDDPMKQGRTLFWFGVEHLSPDWFAQKVARSVKELGARYTAETNIKLPIRKVLHALARDPLLEEERAEWAVSLASATREGDFAAGLPEERRLSRLLLGLLGEFSETEAPACGEYPIDRWLAEVSEADALTRELWRDRIDEDKSPTSSVIYSHFRLREIMGSLGDVEAALRAEHWQYVNDRALLVAGDAGKGKSHLAADACSALVAGQRPALLLLGSKFIEGDIWQQVIQELDLPRDTTGRVFLGALDAAAEAAGARSLLVIDGINERNGTKIWPERLIAFLHDASQFPHVNVVLTCRTTYLETVIPLSLAKTLPRILHRGFSSGDAKAYLAQRKINLPAHPFPLEELQTPLFLKVCCDALDKEGKDSFPKGATGVSDLFGFYSDAVGASVNRRMDLNAGRRFPQRAIMALALEIEETGEREIPYERAAGLIDVIRSGSGRQDDDLVFQLEAEGMITKELTYVIEQPPAESVRFVFERFGDHVVAKGMLSSIPAGSTLETVKASGRLEAIINGSSAVNLGVLEAIAVQLPEQFGVEILDVSDEFHWGIEPAFYASITLRSPKAVTERTFELLRESFDDQQYFETLVALSIEKSTSFNAKYLHRQLASMVMAVRDACWSASVANSFDEAEGKIKRLLDWASSIDRNSIDEEQMLLASIVVAWMCSSTHILARDSATRALVTLLAERSALALKVVDQFKEIDDPYVLERLALAVYGAAVQGTWPASELATVVETAVAGLSLHSPPNVLIRDHLQSLVTYASYRGALPASTSGPLLFASKWPLELVSDAKIGSFVQRYPTGYIGRDEIVSSTVENGNFARYVIDKLACRFSAAPKGTTPLPTVDEVRATWVLKFNATATPEHKARLSELLRMETSDAKNTTSWHPSEELKQARLAFQALVGRELYEEYRVYAMYWRRGEMFQDIHRSDNLACFNLAWARRWVCKRAHDFGWSDELHGDFDRRASRLGDTPNVERIGKKYQWLALFDLAARLDDNADRLPGREAGDLDRLTSFDPTNLARGGGRGLRNEHQAYWMPSIAKRANLSVEEALGWRDEDVDMIDGADAIEVVDPSGGQWLALAAFRSWRFATAKLGVRFSRDLWSRLNSIVVKKDDVSKVLAALKFRQLTDSNALPSNERIHSDMYLGEHGWRSNPCEAEAHTDWGQEFRRGQWRGIKQPAFATTACYERERSDPDHPLTNVEFTLPSLWLMQRLNLRLLDSKELIYGQQRGDKIFTDPSSTLPGPSVGLVSRTIFLEFLEREGLAAIWGVGGEKNLYGENNEGFGGRLIYNRLSHSDGSSVTHLDRTKKLEKPGAEQLARFLGATVRKPRSGGRKSKNES